MQGHAAPLLASKTVLDPRATLHTIRERHGVASLLPTLPLVQHVVTTDVTRRAPRLKRLRRHENLRFRAHHKSCWFSSNDFDRDNDVISFKVRRKWPRKNRTSTFLWSLERGDFNRQIHCDFSREQNFSRSVQTFELPPVL